MHGWCLGWQLLPEQVGGNGEPGSERVDQLLNCQYLQHGLPVHVYYVVLHKNKTCGQEPLPQGSLWCFSSICLLLHCYHNGPSPSSVVTGGPRCLQWRLWQTAPSKQCPYAPGQVTSGLESNVQPRVPDASVNKDINGEADQFVSRMYEVPFQMGRNASHQSRSRHASVHSHR